jgi:hypothetical protein
MELFLKPRAQVPTTRQTPSGFLPRLICKIIEYDTERGLRGVLICIAEDLSDVLDKDNSYMTRTLSQR